MQQFGQFERYFREIWNSLESYSSSSIAEIFYMLFLLSFHELQVAEIGNPVIHHLVVLQHTIEIANEEQLNLLNAGAIALLHDIAPVEKIRIADVIAEQDEIKKHLLEQQRWQHRTLHMRVGSALAQKKLLLLNEYLGKVCYKNNDIEEICEIIRIHDNPSIGIPLSNENKMALAFREADRLWMLSKEGFAWDIHRDIAGIKEYKDIVQLASARIEHIKERYREERQLYCDPDELFQDHEFFFRTKSSFHMFKKYLNERKIEYGI